MVLVNIWIKWDEFNLRISLVVDSCFCIVFFKLISRLINHIVFAFFFFPPNFIRNLLWLLPLTKVAGFNEKVMAKKFLIILKRDNYSKPTCDMARFHFAYPWIKTLHFAHLMLVLLTFRNLPLYLPLEKHIFRFLVFRQPRFQNLKLKKIFKSLNFTNQTPLRVHRARPQQKKPRWPTRFWA